MPFISITYGIAFLAGVSTFFASCLLPLVPLYLMYLTNLSVDGIVKGNRVMILRTSILFTVGFVSMFILMGAGVGIVGKLLAPYTLITNRLVGILFVVLGLTSLNIIPSRFLPHIRVGALVPRGSGLFGAVLMGTVFALAWTPCVGPVLSVILYWSSQQETLLQGTTLLVIYGLGIGVPFVITGLLFKTVAPLLRKFERFGLLLQNISALIIFSVGVLMLFGYFQYFSLLFLQKLGLNRYAQ